LENAVFCILIYQFSQKQIFKMRQGLGIATNNAAEYHGLILGLKHAIEKGYTKIKVKTDSKLVCMQVGLSLCNKVI